MLLEEVVIATQNPMDLDYRALSNAGLWCVGRLQTDADRARVIEGLSGNGGAAGNGASAAELTEITKRLAPRWFVMRDVHAETNTTPMACRRRRDYPPRMQAFDAQPPPLAEDEHGVIRVAGTRVQLETVVTAFDLGATPEEIVQSYTTLDLPSVYAVIAYVLQNRPRIDAYMAKRQNEADRVRLEVEQQFPQKGIRERLLARRSVQRA